jgi:hypothetical protein
MGTNPNPKQLGGMNHVALEVMDRSLTIWR